MEKNETVASRRIEVAATFTGGQAALLVSRSWMFVDGSVAGATDVWFAFFMWFFSLTLLIRRFLGSSCPKNEWQV